MKLCGCDRDGGWSSGGLPLVDDIAQTGKLDYYLLNATFARQLKAAAEVEQSTNPSREPRVLERCADQWRTAR